MRTWWPCSTARSRSTMFISWWSTATAETSPTTWPLRERSAKTPSDCFSFNWVWLLHQTRNFNLDELNRDDFLLLLLLPLLQPAQWKLSLQKASFTEIWNHKTFCCRIPAARVCRRPPTSPWKSPISDLRDSCKMETWQRLYADLQWWVDSSIFRPPVVDVSFCFVSLQYMAPEVIMSLQYDAKAGEFHLSAWWTSRHETN